MKRLTLTLLLMLWAGVAQGANYGSYISGLSPVAHWRTFSGSTLTDVINGYNATAAAGREPTAGTSPLLHQTGSPQIQTYSRAATADGFAIASPATNLRFAHTDSFTIMAWVKIVPAGGATHYCIFANSLQSGTFRGVITEINGTGTGAPLQLSIINTNGSNALICTFTPPERLKFFSGYPRLVTFTYDGSQSNSGVKGYVDGYECTRATVQNNLSATSDAGAGVPATIGYRGESISGHTLDGDMGELAIFRRVLTQAEIIGAWREGMPYLQDLDLSWMGSRPKIIIDADCDSDIDDMLDLTALIRAHRAGQVEIVAIANTSEETYSAGCIRALLDYWQLQAVPVYSYHDAIAGVSPTGGYPNNVVSAYSPVPDEKTEFDDVSDIGADILTPAANNSLTWITTGTADSAAKLLAANASLFNQKVKLMISVASQAPAGTGISDFAYNDEWDDVFSSYTNDWIFVPIWTGDNISTGSGIDSLATNNPLYTAWNAYGSQTSRPNWGAPMHDFIATAGNPTNSYLFARGTATRTTGTGAIAWTYNSSTGKHWVLVSASDSSLGTMIDGLVNANFRIYPLPPFLLGR